ncbi:hypothetical protein ACWIGI_41380 [Nocardia sp. NPDC055321]
MRTSSITVADLERGHRLVSGDPRVNDRVVAFVEERHDHDSGEVVIEVGFLGGGGWEPASYGTPVTIVGGYVPDTPARPFESTR